MVSLRISHILYIIICYSKSIEVLPGFFIRAVNALQSARPTVRERVDDSGGL